MASPTWHFDGVLKRIYEVPSGATYTMNGGYRVYNGGVNSPILSVDVKKDLWSRWVDWQSLNDWAILAFSVSGGTLRPTGENAPADFSLLTSVGWGLVLANYPHETIFYGNLFAEGTDSLFDNSLLTNVGVVPRLQGSANLLTYSYDTSGEPAPTVEQIRAEMDNNSIKLDEIAYLTSRLHRLLGLEVGTPVFIGDTQQEAGDINMTMTKVGNITRLETTE